jgi:hypothetical protein
MKKKYVDNDVFQFRIQVDNDLFSKEITVYTKPFHKFILGELSEKEWYKEYNKQEELVQKKFFTQEKINELKQELIKQIQECDNPFYIFCLDRDSGYNVTEDKLFDLNN